MFQPDYKGGSIVNLMSSIARARGGKTPYTPLKLLPPKEIKDYKNIVPPAKAQDTVLVTGVFGPIRLWKNRYALHHGLVASKEEKITQEKTWSPEEILKEEYNENMRIEEVIKLALKCIVKSLEEREEKPRMKIALIPSKTKKIKMLNQEEINSYLKDL